MCRDGSDRPSAASAERTRSRDSATALSGSPTTAKAGSPAVIVTWASTSTTSTPLNATVRTRATMPGPGPPPARFPCRAKAYGRMPHHASRASQTHPKSIRSESLRAAPSHPQNRRPGEGRDPPFNRTRGRKVDPGLRRDDGQGGVKASQPISGRVAYQLFGGSSGRVSRWPQPALLAQYSQVRQVSVE